MKLKRYQDRLEIEKAIDLANEKRIQALKEADKSDMQADGHFKKGSETYNPYMGEEKRLTAKKLRKQAYRIETIKLPQLGRTLAAFDTAPLGGPGHEDRAVVTQV